MEGEDEDDDGKGDGSDDDGEAVVVEAQTLSQVLDAARLGAQTIDLLKVDVEGDELKVLQGLTADRWPSVRQVVAEVHNVDDRLEHVCTLLHGRGFRVTVEAQRGGTVRGYRMVVPESLSLFYVYAVRPTEAVRSSARLNKGVSLNICEE